MADLTRTAPDMLDNVKWTVDDIDTMKAETRFKTGNVVEILGYYRPWDEANGAQYEIVTAAEYGATPDEIIDHTLNDGRIARLIVQGLMKAEWAGVCKTPGGKMGNRANRFTAAFQYATLLNDDIYDGDDGEIQQFIDTRGITFTCNTSFKAANMIEMTKPSGSACENMRIEMNCLIVAVGGEGFDAHTQERPIPLVLWKGSNCFVKWPKFRCEMRCAGIKAKVDIGNQHHGLDLRGFSRYGLWCVANNDSTWWDPIIKQFTRNPNFIRNGVDPTDWSNWNGDCIITSTKDRRFIGGQVGWGGPCVRILDTYPDTNPERIPGRNCYWCGLEAGQDYLDGDNGGGDDVFDNLHVMQGISNNAFIAISGPRYGAWMDWDLATNSQIVRTEDSPVGVLSFCEIGNLSFFDRLDDDGCIHLLYGAQAEFKGTSPGSSGRPVTKSTDTAHWLDPKIRIYASRTAGGDERYPYMTSMSEERGMTINFLPNPNYIYWDGAALVKQHTEWVGDFSEWNRMNRASGSYSGPMIWKGTRVAGTLLPGIHVDAAGDYFVVSGDGTIGTYSVSDGDILIALTATPGPLDWLVVDPQSAPVRANVTPTFQYKFTTHAHPHRYIIYPGKHGDQPYVTETTGDNWMARSFLVGTDLVTYSWDGVSFRIESDVAPHKFYLGNGDNGLSVNSGALSFWAGDTEYWFLSNVGNLRPNQDGTLNIGSSSFRVAKTFTNSLDLDGPLVLAGTGSPEGVVTAPVSSTYHRKDGGAGTSFYVKESGTGNTGWVAK